MIDSSKLIAAERERQAREDALYGDICGGPEPVNQFPKYVESLEKENRALRAEVNGLRAKLGMGRKYVEWGDTPRSER